MKTKGLVPSPLRYCLSCVVTLAFGALWLVLGAALVAQCYVGVIKDVPVPGFVLRHIEAALAAENLSVRFGSAHFDPRGQLLLENAQLRARAAEEPVFFSRLVLVHKSIWSLLAGRPMPDEVSFEGATLQLPAIFSPSGTAEPLLREMAGRIRFESGECHVDQLTFHIGRMSVAMNGIMTRPHTTRGTPLAPAVMIDRFLQYGRKIALLLPQLDAADKPALVVESIARPQGGMSLGLTFTADGVHGPAGLPVELGPVSATGRWIWDGISPHSLRLHFMLASGAGPKGLTVAEVRGDALLEPPEAEFASVAWVEARVAASNVQALGEDWSLPVVSGSYSIREGLGRFTAALRSHDELLAAKGEASPHEGSARISFEGRVPPALVTGLLTRYGPKLEPYFRFGDPVDVQGRVILAGGWKFAGLASRVQGGRLDSHGVQVTSTRGRIDLDAGLNFLAYDAQVVAGENEARGSYWMNFHNFDYRMLLTGRLRPPDITGWFRSEWWPDFWKNFSFPAAPPQADVDLQGCWKNPSLTSYFGVTDAMKPVVLGEEFDRARARIFLRPQFADVLELAVERAGGTQRASGWFRRRGGSPGHRDEASSFDYDLAGNLELAAYEKMGGATAAKLLGAWQFDQPPQVRVAGHTDLNAGKAVNALQFSAVSKGGLQYDGLPLEGLSVDGGLHGDDLRLDRIDFQFAGGHGSATASLDGPPEARQLGLEASLKDADLARTIRAAENFETTRTGTNSSSVTESKFIKRVSGGKLELTLGAQGNPADVASFRGNGTVQLSGGELGEIHLFGLLSQVLSAVALNFTSLKLDAARSSFQLGEGRVHFPDVKITGPNAMIDAKGDYLFASKSLDFTAKLKPFEESHNPLSAVVGIVMNPLTSIFELKLSGPLAKPSWSIVLGQGPKPDANSAPADAPKNPALPAPEGGGK